jgi:hypothetical protein
MTPSRKGWETRRRKAAEAAEAAKPAPSKPEFKLPPPPTAEQMEEAKNRKSAGASNRG